MSYAPLSLPEAAPNLMPISQATIPYGPRILHIASFRSNFTQKSVDLLLNALM
jgi:hypothetical protein